MSKPVAIDLFCGAGGMTYGMKKAGIDVIAGIDVDSRIGKVYETNNRPSRFINKDTRYVTGREILELFGDSQGSRILAGCAPCRPFSIINRKRGRLHSDYSLLDSFSRLIREVEPDGVIMENVPGITGSGKAIFQRFLRALGTVGLHPTYEIVDAADFGVPQHRKRLFLIASRVTPKIPRLTNGPRTKREYKTVKDAISKFPPIGSGHMDTGPRNHSCKTLEQVNITRLKLTPKDGGSRNQVPKELWIPTHLKHDGHSDTYGRMSWNEPAPTLTCRCISISNGRFAHPEQDRGISIREAATLQTFPRRYRFPANFTVAQMAIGNAVPPLLATKFSRALLRSMTELS
jgi:DNA (cytosine-5)-methyltransferase 1